LPKKYLSGIVRAKSIASDPLIPDDIKDLALDLLKGYCDAWFDSAILAMDDYRTLLEKGQYWNDLKYGGYFVEYEIVKYMAKRDYSLDECEDKASKIRNSIKNYFDSYNPMRQDLTLRKRLENISLSLTKRGIAPPENAKVS